ncbi:helix-turn-helix domain-containing protein [Sphingopyxis sp. BSN-002]|uniref:helix-turn-helix domain-containing protein n=1 Tax=Sphingopyxis sp. BSN-002 TaxID=2911495 RepID=UPI001EDA2655|nr:helix-turn-helix domain-containing protein [Sphingopyxis sp. BSN-002]QVJ07664.1 antitoxin [Sphingopyxis phage VSN-002]UKK84732.1 helix-turn-helix domain-containing protein [Sphingopyxis sp. BSN-002]
MTEASQIIADKGGTVKVAAALDLTPSTVSSWKKAKGGIPRWWLPHVQALPKAEPTAA